MYCFSYLFTEYVKVSNAHANAHQATSYFRVKIFKVDFLFSFFYFV